MELPSLDLCVKVAREYPYFLGIAKSARFWEQYPCCCV